MGSQHHSSPCPPPPFLTHPHTSPPPGEPWDYMGSRRLLLDMSMNTTSTSGLNLTLIDQVGFGEW